MQFMRAAFYSMPFERKPVEKKKIVSNPFGGEIAHHFLRIYLFCLRRAI